MESYKGIPQPLPIRIPGAPSSLPKPHVPNVEGTPKSVVEREALALFMGTTTMAKLFNMYDADTIQEIITTNNKFNSDSPILSEEKTENDIIKIPSISEIHSIINEYKKIPLTDISEGKFIKLVNDLKENKLFKNLLEQYESLMREFPDRTEEYELKAVQDFIEFYPELIKE